MSGFVGEEPLPRLGSKPVLAEPDPEWREAIAVLRVLVDRGWVFRTRGPFDRPLEPTAMLAELESPGWLDVVLIDGHDQAQAMRYAMQQTPRRPVLEKIERYTSGALAEVVYKVLGWPADRL